MQASSSQHQTETVQQQPSSSSNGVGGASDCDPFIVNG